LSSCLTEAPEFKNDFMEVLCKILGGVFCSKGVSPGRRADVSGGSFSLPERCSDPAEDCVSILPDSVRSLFFFRKGAWQAG
jgi:hypothetical protein